MRHKSLFIAIIATYLLISFVPQLSLMSLLGKGKKG